jgi:thiol-disulfide isomerase/thioredoxin
VAQLIAHYLWMAIALLPVQVPDVNGRAVRPLELNGAPATVLVFVATDCPISNGYAPELQRIMAEHKADGVRFYLVYADPTTTAAAAKAHMATYGYHCSALLDPHGALAARVGATVTPEVAVIGAGGTVLYRGRVDDRYVAFGRKRPAATTHDLRDAISAVLAGRAVRVARTTAVGCPI